MLFASTELAARIERAEARLMGDVARAALRRRQGAGCFELPIGGGVATFTAPGSPLNKVAGAGFAGPLDPAELDAVERAFAERGVPVQFELSCLADPKIAALLTRRGYALVNFENVLGRRLPVEPQPRPEGIEIEESGDGERDAWLDLVVTGFASPDVQGVASHESFPRDELERVMDDMAEAEGFVRYLARRGGAPAGGASQRIFDGVAQLCGAATLPGHRRHGVQSALLQARLEIASRAGCDIAVVTGRSRARSRRRTCRSAVSSCSTHARSWYARREQRPDASGRSGGRELERHVELEGASCRGRLDYELVAALVLPALLDRPGLAGRRQKGRACP